MKLKDLIPLLFTEDTSSKDRVVRIEMPDPVCKFVYEGRIIDFYNDCIVTPLVIQFTKVIFIGLERQYGNSTYCNLHITSMKPIQIWRKYLSITGQ